MLKRISMLSFAAVALAGCDAATQIAGDAVEGEVRNAVAAQCEQVAESAGIVAGRVAEVCECSADAYLADPDRSMADVSRERIEGIVNQCAAEAGAASDTSTQPTPAEEIGG